MWGRARKTERARKEVADTNSSQMWKAFYILLLALFLCLLVLHLAYVDHPGMRKYYFLSNRAYAAIVRSERDLNYDDLFPAPSRVE